MLRGLPRYDGPLLKRCSVNGLVHVVAYDGITFCMNGWADDETAEKPTLITCLQCMVGWSGWLAS